MVQSALEKQKQKQEFEKAVGELQQIYDQKKQKVVAVTSGSSMDEALRNYERRERVAHDVGKYVVKRKGPEEQGKE
jgi:hypothetical protein